MIYNYTSVKEVVEGLKGFVSVTKGGHGVDAVNYIEQLEQLDGWYLTNDAQRIRKDWTVKNFVAGMDFFNGVMRVAEEDGHHPDLHIWGYRNVWIELWTHAIGGLSENDFILAAKIDQLPVELKEA